MSGLLDFGPPKALPPDINSPPYVIFSINGSDVSSQLPPKIPLAMVLHFAPKLKELITKTPNVPPKAIKPLALHKPPVGINIQGAEILALLVIIHRMMQLCGRPLPRERFNPNVGLTVAICIIALWRYLELPGKGVEALETRMMTSLMLKEPVQYQQMVALWCLYPSNSPMIVEMGRSFIREHVYNAGYDDKEYTDIKNWIEKDRDRRKFFASFDKEFRKEIESSEIIVHTKGGGSSRAPIPISAKDATEMVDAADKAAKPFEILEQNNTIRVSMQGKRERERKDLVNMRQRIRRLKSDDSLRSVETVIHSPEPTTPTPVDAQHGTTNMPVENTSQTSAEKCAKWLDQSGHALPMLPATTFAKPTVSGEVKEKDDRNSET